MDARTTGLGRVLLTLFVAAGCALPLGYAAGRAAFGRVFSSFDNHDTAAPLLLAAPVALVVFTLVAGAACALVAALAALLLGRSRKPSA